MRNFIARIVVGLFALTLLTSPRLAMAQSTGAGDSSEIGGGLGTGDFKDASNESTGLTATLRSVAKYALYVFYLLGVIFMGVTFVQIPPNAHEINAMRAVERAAYRFIRAHGLPA